MAGSESFRAALIEAKQRSVIYRSQQFADRRQRFFLADEQPLILIRPQEQKPKKNCLLGSFFSAPGEIRTPDPLIRSQML